MKTITPDWQLDQMYENESAQMWEELNAHNEEWDKKLEAVGYMNVAIEKLREANKSLLKAKDELFGVSAEYRIGSLIDDFDDLVSDLNLLRQKFIDGEG